MALLLECFFILLSTVSVFSVKTPPEENYYHAAVVEYSPLDGKDPLDSIIKNAEEYSSLIDLASKHADIVVFPEEGLFFFDKGSTIFIEVPFGNHTTTPGDDKDSHYVIKLLSKAARRNGIYVVVNLHEKYQSGSETLHYNTNVIFDRNGSIIARYRKTNLFNEPMNITKTPEHIYFDSDFGVRFGTFICFDILFKEPSLMILEKYNVTDILYPTMWFSGLPFLTAVQTQAAWAYATDTNFLAAGSNSVRNSNTGSGIYGGKKGPIVYLQSQRNQTRILFAKVIKKGKSGTPTGEMSSPTRMGPKDKLNIWGDNVMPNIKSSLITSDPNISSNENFQDPKSDFAVNQEFSNNLCHNGFCCSFVINATFTYKHVKDSLKPTFSNPYYYRIAVYNGTQSYYVRNVGVQICSIISCLNKSLASCGKPLEDYNVIAVGSLDSNLSLVSTVFHKITIRTSYLDYDSLTVPDILELSDDSDVFGSLMNASKFSFSLDDRTAELNLSSDKLVTAALYSRVFSRDDPTSVATHSGSFFSFSVSLLLILVCFIYYII